tara:strand:- start:1755 stop:2765 length:1011 start_codon:yes stop_codon:yes gene_type:complete
MKVLIYIGYQKKELVYDDFINNNHIGGTEVTALKLAESLCKYGVEVYFGGQIESGSHNNVEWLNLADCSTKYFDLAISASYVHFVDTIDCKYRWFWWHNTDFHPWKDGITAYDSSILNDIKIDRHITLTNWHRDFIKEEYNIQSPVDVIGNAIDRKTFNGKLNKVRDSFIYSSAADRGLYRLLQMWPEVLLEMPNATLNVFCPGYSSPEVKNWPEGVTYHGTVSQEVLHAWQMKSEYWLHPTDYVETYCITALEMQYAKVIPITTRLAALDEIVHNRGYLLNQGETNQSFINIIKEIKNSNGLKDVFRNKGHQWAKQQDWNVRVIEWVQLINKTIK